MFGYGGVLGSLGDVGGSIKDNPIYWLSKLPTASFRSGPGFRSVLVAVSSLRGKHRTRSRTIFFAGGGID